MFGIFTKPHLNGNAAALDSFAKDYKQTTIKLRNKAEKIRCDIGTCVTTLQTIATTKGESNGKPNTSTNRP